jgi:oxygen-independent coproporphyrinogen-3 oxidase
MYKSADRILTSNGFSHYEISNYSLEGRKSRHNLKYWSCDEYLGFGVASHSFINQTRYSNTSSINEYIDSIENDKIYYSVEEILSTDELIEEYIMMRLRLCDGLSLKAFEDKFSKKIDNKYISRMNPFIKSGHIICTDDKFSLSAEGMYVSNYILTEILDLGL